MRAITTRHYMARVGTMTMKLNGTSYDLFICICRTDPGVVLRCDCPGPMTRKEPKKILTTIM